ncbi:DUF3888 domain-containing protein [Anoxybacteroides tepidamans]|uniref:DUF3888 domain-containing protein n=1 Tax=Anoxybacteroides tepidamans TaxID=265948 RepID=UPI0006870E8F|nr:DUF3888 domain-containing protein [Anoxybacillus tepidamans]
MKRIVISLFICLLFWNISWPYQAMAESNRNSEKKHTDFYDAVLVLLDPYARKAIENKYPTRSYGLWNAEILEVHRKTEGFSQYNFIIKVKYDTYTGPHNPPEGPVTLTFDVNLDRVTVTEIE